MNDLTSRLTQLAAHLEKKAKLSDALSEDHAANREPAEALRMKRRAESARAYAADCIHAAKILTMKARRAGFVPPTIDEVRAYTGDKFPLWPVSDVTTWYDHFQSVGWKVNTKPMVSWEHAANNGYKRWLEKNPQRGASPAVDPRKKPDPEGWREFLTARNRPYKEHRFEQEWVRTEFRKSAKK